MSLPNISEGTVPIVPLPPAELREKNLQDEVESAKKSFREKQKLYKELLVLIDPKESDQKMLEARVEVVRPTGKIFLSGATLWGVLVVLSKFTTLAVVGGFLGGIGALSLGAGAIFLLVVGIGFLVWSYRAGKRHAIMEIELTNKDRATLKAAETELQSAREIFSNSVHQLHSFLEAKKKEMIMARLKQQLDSRQGSFPSSSKPFTVAEARLELDAALQQVTLAQQAYKQAKEEWEYLEEAEKKEEMHGDLGIARENLRDTLHALTLARKQQMAAQKNFNAAAQVENMRRSQHAEKLGGLQQELKEAKEHLAQQSISDETGITQEALQRAGKRHKIKSLEAEIDKLKQQTSVGKRVSFTVDPVQEEEPAVEVNEPANEEEQKNLASQTDTKKELKKSRKKLAKIRRQLKNATDENREALLQRQAAQTQHHETLTLRNQQPSTQSEEEEIVNPVLVAAALSEES